MPEQHHRKSNLGFKFSFKSKASDNLWSKYCLIWIIQFSGINLLQKMFKIYFIKLL